MDGMQAFKSLLGSLADGTSGSKIAGTGHSGFLMGPVLASNCVLRD